MTTLGTQDAQWAISSPLEFAGVVFGPAFDYHFFVGVELDGVAALAVHVAKKTVFPAAEREVRHWCGDADVDADISSRSLVTKTPRSRAAGSEQRRLVAKRILLQKIHRFVHIICVNQAEHRAEDFGVRECAVCRNTVEDRGFHEISRFLAGNFGVAAID